MWKIKFGKSAIDHTYFFGKKKSWHSSEWQHQEMTLNVYQENTQCEQFLGNGGEILLKRNK